MVQLVKQHKTIQNHWACSVFPSASFAVFLVRTNIEKCGMQFVTATFAPTYL